MDTHLASEVMSQCFSMYSTVACVDVPVLGKLPQEAKAAAKKAKVAQSIARQAAAKAESQEGKGANVSKKAKAKQEADEKRVRLRSTMAKQHTNPAETYVSLGLHSVFSSPPPRAIAASNQMHTYRVAG